MVLNILKTHATSGARGRGSRQQIPVPPRQFWSRRPRRLLFWPRMKPRFLLYKYAENRRFDAYLAPSVITTNSPYRRKCDNEGVPAASRLLNKMVIMLSRFFVYLNQLQLLSHFRVRG